MSEKEIKAGEGFVRMGTLSHRKDTAFVRVRDGLEHTQALVNLGREEFLAGVAEAFDVFIVERKDAPTVVRDENDRVRIKGSTTPWVDTADEHRRVALRHLALAEFIEANPPIDKEALGVLTAIVLEEAQGDTTTALARRLYDRGVRLVSE